MSLILIDGFDHYGSSEAGQVQRKWLAYLGGASSVNARRKGTRSWVFTPAATSLASHRLAALIPDTPNTVVVGLGVKWNSMEDEHFGFIIKRAGVIQATVKINTDGSIEVLRGDYDGGSAESLGVSLAGVIPPLVWKYLEFSITIHDSTGAFEIRVNESMVLEGSNLDTQAGTIAGIDRIQLRGTKTGSGFMYIDDVYIDTDTFHGDCRVDTLWPDGAGSNAEWSPIPSGTDNYANVDDATNMDDDTTHNATDVTNEIDTVTFDDLDPIDTTIIGVALNLALNKTEPGIMGVTPVCIIDSVEYTGDEQYVYEIHPGDGIGYKIGAQQIWEGPPDAPSDAWTESDVNSAEFGGELTT
jgi:hypothetical protein